jgi:Dna[CI] antecedent, DciA
MFTRSSRARALQRAYPMSGRKPRNTEPTHVGALLGGGPLARTGHVDRERWRRIVGDRVAARTRPGQLRSGTLTIHAASAVWAQELSLLSTTIIERLKSAGVDASSLRFRVGEVEPLAAAPTREPDARRAPLPDELSQKLAAIGDPDLRAQMTEAAAYSLGKESKRASTSERQATRGPRSAAPGSDPTARESTRRFGGRKGIA